MRPMPPTGGTLQGNGAALATSAIGPAAGALAAQFDDAAVHAKTELLRATRQQAGDFRVVHFRHVAAVAADEELHAALVARIAAAHVRVEGRDPVHETLAREELERAVHRGRRRVAPLLPEHREDVVGLDRLVAAPHELEYPPAQFREAQATLGAGFLRPRERPLEAAIMRMPRLGKRGNDLPAGHRLLLETGPIGSVIV